MRLQAWGVQAARYPQGRANKKQETLTIPKPKTHSNTQSWNFTYLNEGDIKVHVYSRTTLCHQSYEVPSLILQRYTPISFQPTAPAYCKRDSSPNDLTSRVPTTSLQKLPRGWNIFNWEREGPTPNLRCIKHQMEYATLQCSCCNLRD